MVPPATIIEWQAECLSSARISKLPPSFVLGRVRGAALRVVAGVLILILSTLARAEIFMDIGPLDNLGDVKNKLPNARVEKFSPGWAKNTEALYQFSGDGIGGSLIVKFDDSRTDFKKLAEKEPNPESADTYRALAQLPDEQALAVGWVRWVPARPIPIQRLVSRYGKPDNKGFSDDNYEPYRGWNRGVTAYLSDDEKLVYRIDFSFTKEEFKKAFAARLILMGKKSKTGKN